MPDNAPPQNGDPERELLRDMSERATLLYWNSDKSVNSIADDLGLSKGRLYELIQPLKSGQQCPNCQSDLIFDNRTSRERDEPICPNCDAGPVPALRSRSGASAGDPVSPEDLAAEGDLTGNRPEPLGLTGLVAGLLIGTAVGVLIGRARR